MYNSVEELLERAKTENKRLHEVIAQNEMSISDISEEMLYDRLEKHYQTMVASAAKAVNAPQDMPGVDFIKGQSLKQAQYSESQTLGGSYLNNIMTMALSCCEVNAGMGRIWDSSATPWRDLFRFRAVFATQVRRQTPSRARTLPLRGRSALFHPTK